MFIGLKKATRQKPYLSITQGYHQIYLQFLIDLCTTDQYKCIVTVLVDRAKGVGGH